MKKIFFVLTALGAFSSSLLGITLEESVTLALKNNLSLQAAAEDIGIADGMYREVTSSLLPQISLSGGYQMQRTELPGSMIPPAIDVTGNLGDNATEDEQMLAGYLEQGFNSFLPERTEDETSFVGQIKLDQVVYLGGKLLSGIRAAGIYKTVERKRYEMLQQELIYQTTDLFYQGLLLEDLIAINREALQLAGDHFKRIEKMFDQGLVSEFDLIRAELELLKLQPQLQEAENNYILSAC
jgi:outer membrane protein TolC